MKPKHIIQILLPLLVLSCVKDGKGERLREGEPLPVFSVTTLNGTRFTTEDLAGKPSAVILFDTRCPDCHRQLPELEKAWLDLGNEISVIAIAREEGEDAVRDHWKTAGYTMPVAAPGNRTIYELFDRHSGSGVPQLYLADPSGTVIGYADDSKVMTSDKITSILHQ